MKLNDNFFKLKNSYLFSEVSKRVAGFENEHKDVKLLKLGIGDVTKPLAPIVVSAMEKAVKEMGNEATFRGYGPSEGYLFLRQAVKERYKRLFGVETETDEIFISDGAKSDCGNLSDIVGKDNTVLIPDPVYPVYVDTNIMAGREIFYIDASEENNFLPMPDCARKADIIYICSPNNPTGAAYDKQMLQKWVDYAVNNNSLIIFDAAYEAFIEDDNIPHSIFEIEGAKSCAVEVGSLSKTAGFTGTRCGYLIIPHKLKFDGVELNALWYRRQSAKFNGVSYPVQVAAAAALSEEGSAQIMESVRYYKENAKIIISAMEKIGLWYTGGKNSPYIWFKCPNNMKSWDFFDLLLNKAGVVGTPGEGFGRNGEGFFRISSFGDTAVVEEAVARMAKI